MALLGIIRRWHLHDQVSLRKIAKRLGIPHNTVRRYLRSKTTGPAYAERQSASGIDPHAFHLAGRLKIEAAKSRKQRRSLKQLHEDLTELGGGRGLTTEWRRSPCNGGRGKQSGSIRRAKEHPVFMLSNFASNLGTGGCRPSLAAGHSRRQQHSYMAEPAIFQVLDGSLAYRPPWENVPIKKTSFPIGKYLNVYI